MNNTWGDMAQYDPVTWNWVIAVYLFMAGLSAGSVLIGIGMRWYSRDKQTESPILKAAALIGPVAISLGLACLVFDLTKPFHFWLILVNYNFQSVMAIGVAALLAYSPLGIAYALIVLKDDLPKWKLGFLSGIADLLMPFRKIIEVLLFILAIGVGAYTGFLISAMNAYPMLNTAVLPALFLVSGLSAGAAANLVVALLMFNTDTHSPEVAKMHRIELPVIIAEMMFLVMLFSALYFTGGSAATALASLNTGIWASVFWIGVVGIGFAIPLLAMLLPSSARHSKALMLTVACCSLTGVLALRHFIVYAGQSYIS
ncbi:MULTISPECIES: NrfD/PsrC family molybdoenzyme membrane anchor subunit [Shewanella]|uniref:Polysulfide reductase n=1 Tax=Shewanella psychromarinicola TaxID=2487742 RepID=A0A3N4EKL8_9GAMM|nr:MULTISPECIES: NrfD/PsrC family molybdoenzyme membrane anchor subunit [Shewanella]AZG36311.1 polysulfide reductase [Shewanella psychromarinicola]MCL1080820.1 polysulfide reductase NrfD [Shewanella psychromarinicola]PKG77605.1 polysulfide reductase [Shewanella sp. Actino-trap-3]RPA34151.1 polysulfide reductase [Shewanella psychromarinicola]